MDGALRGFADALLRAAKNECSASGRATGARCDDALCRVAAFHDALARDDYEGLAAALAPAVEVEHFGVHHRGFTRLARGVEAVLELLRSNESAMRWRAVTFESATVLEATLILFRHESGAFAGNAHEAFVVTHYQLRDGLITRIRARAFPDRQDAH
jgi:ketosteroid isomerase-like protein